MHSCGRHAPMTRPPPPPSAGTCGEHGVLAAARALMWRVRCCGGCMSRSRSNALCLAEGIFFPISLQERTNPGPEPPAASDAGARNRPLGAEPAVPRAAGRQPVGIGARRRWQRCPAACHPGCTIGSIHRREPSNINATFCCNNSFSGQKERHHQSNEALTTLTPALEALSVAPSG